MKTHYRVGYAYVDGGEGNAPFDTKTKAVEHARAMATASTVLTDTVRIVRYVTSTVPFRTRLK